jgi:hypothetical protein
MTILKGKTQKTNKNARPSRKWWSFINKLCASSVIWAVLLCAEAEYVQAHNIKEISKLIELAEPGKRDNARWAKAIMSALQGHRLELSMENICSTIAIIDQESSFHENPSVPKLGENSLVSFEKTLSDNYLMRLIFEYRPEILAQLRNDIRSTNTELDLDIAMRKAFDGFRSTADIGYLISAIDSFGDLSSLFEDFHKIKTVGSMQVSVAFARKLHFGSREASVDESYAFRDFLYTIEGGVYYGVAKLQDPVSSKNTSVC